MKRGFMKRTAFKSKSVKKKKPSVSQTKKKVWVQFSIFIRTRGADSEGWNTCVTCGVRKFWRDLQAGHFIRGRLNATLFNETGVWPQCYGCNVGAQGNVVLYYKWMLARFGQGTIDRLIEQNNHTHKWGATELGDLFTRYSSLNKNNPLVEK
jgi:hypothetical protein